MKYKLNYTNINSLGVVNKVLPVNRYSLDALALSPIGNHTNSSSCQVSADSFARVTTYHKN